MIAVLQRVTSAEVAVGERIVGKIGPGLLVLVGVEKGDAEEDARYLVDRILGMRVFSDSSGKMNINIREAGGSMLIVSQFTLLADVTQGRRPDFSRAAEASVARKMFDLVVTLARQSGIVIETGEFQASMSVSLNNDGPVTIICHSRR